MKKQSLFLLLFCSVQLFVAQSWERNLSLEKWSFSQEGKSEILPAKVPGTVHTDLFINKKKIDEQNNILKGVYDKMKQYYILQGTNGNTVSTNPSSVLALLAPHIYKIGIIVPTNDNKTNKNNKNKNPIQQDDYTRGEKNLCNVPKCIVRNIADAITGTSSTGIMNIVQPHFLRRQKVLGHIQKIQQSDVRK